MPREIHAGAVARLRNLVDGVLNDLADGCGEFRDLHFAQSQINAARSQLRGAALNMEQAVAKRPPLPDPEPILGFDFKSAHQILRDAK